MVTTEDRQIVAEIVRDVNHVDPTKKGLEPIAASWYWLDVDDTNESPLRARPNVESGMGSMLHVVTNTQGRTAWLCRLYRIDDDLWKIDFPMCQSTRLRIAGGTLEHAKLAAQAVTAQRLRDLAEFIEKE